MAETIIYELAAWVAGNVSTEIGIAIFVNAEAIATAAMLTGGLALSQSQIKKAKQKAKDAYNAAQVDRLVTVDSPVAARELVMGRTRKAGTVAFKGSAGTNKETFIMVGVLAAHEIDAVEAVYLNDELVTIDGSGNVTTAPYGATNKVSASATLVSGTVTLPNTPVAGSVSVSRSAGDYDEAVGFTLVGNVVTAVDLGTGIVNYQYEEPTGTSAANIRFYLGAAGQTADARLQTLFPGVWTANHRGDGLAYFILETTYSETAFPSGLPSISVVLRGAKAYDPRTGLTVWTENPAIMQRHALLHPHFGKRTGLTASEDARIVTAANACDTSTTYTVGGVGTTRALYTAATVQPYGAPCRAVLDDLAQAMGGQWAYAQGEFFTRAGVYSAPVLSFGDADLATVATGSDGAKQQRSIQISPHRPRAEQINIVTPRIWDAGQGYKQVALTPLKASALITRDGAELSQEVTFSAVGYAPQAQHIAGIMLRDARDPLAVTLHLKLSAYRVDLFDVISLTLAAYGWSSKPFLVTGRTYTVDSMVQLSLRETAAAVYQPDASFLPQGYASNSLLPKPWDISPPVSLTITSGTADLIKQQDGTIVSRMRVTWPAIANAAVTYGGFIELQYRLATSTGAWEGVKVSGAETQAFLGDVSDGKVYVVRARSTNSVAVSLWGVQASHLVVGKTVPPPPFDTFLIAAQPDGTRQYNFGYTGSAPTDWLGGQIRYVSGTDPAPDWDTMTPLQDGTTYYTNSPVEQNAPLAGTYTFASKSVDTTFNASTYVVRTVTLPDRRLGNVFDEFFEHSEGWLGTKTGCHVQDTYLEANDSTTWATLPSTWAAWTRWNTTPTSPIYYETPARDFGTIIAGQINSTIDADGTVVQELATSTDGSTWTGWSTAASPFSTRYLKMRVTVTATGPAPVPVVRTFAWQVNAPIRSEYLNDVVISALTGSYRIGTGDIRIPLAGTYSVLKRTSIVVQDNSAGTWTYARIDQSLSPSPRWQFRLNGTLADPSFVDFFIEGY